MLCIAYTTFDYPMIFLLKVQQQLQSVQDENGDLKEKLETIKVKRARDLDKLKEFEKMRIQHDQLVEFKSRIMESQSAIQKELQKAKHEAREAVEAKEQHAEEMADLSETVEMATLDKEMAEEKAETLQLELDAAKEKIEELTLDMDIIKAEMGDETATTDGTITHFEVKQLSAKNEKMHETLIRMRDLSAHEKSEILRLTKDLEAKTSEVTDLASKVERLQREKDGLDSTIGDLQEQVDAALGAEEMVENLTTKCLDLEDKLNAVTEEKQDLETLHEMDEELQENLRDTEQELREDLDLANAKVREAARARDAAYEIIHDHETTITKFRDLVNKVQEQNLDLRASLEKQTSSFSTRGGQSGDAAMSNVSDIIDFKKMFAESKAHSRAIDMELRNCDVAQANRHISLLSLYMAVSFTARGGDNEAVLVLLLVPRMIWKANILMSQLKEKFMLTNDVTPIERNQLIKKNSEVERYAYGGQMIHNLNQLTSVLYNYHHALSTCPPATFLRVGTLYPEMSAHEKAGIDFFIELLRKDQLDENVPTASIEKCINYFQQVYPLHLAEDVKMDHTNVLANHLKSLQSACECLDTGLSIGKALLPNGSSEAGSELSILYKTTEGEVNQLKQVVKSMKRRLPQKEEQVSLTGVSANGGDTAASSCTYILSAEPVVIYSATEAQKTDMAVKDVSKLTKAFGLFCKNGTQQASLLSESESGIPIQKLTNLLKNAVDSVYLEDTYPPMGDDETPLNGFEIIKSIMKKTIKTIGEQNRALQDGEWDVSDIIKEKESRSSIVAPVLIRAETYKQEIKDAEGMKYRLESKEDGLKELKRSLKEKAEELSEMQVRKDKAEKRVNDATRDAEMIREKLQRKLDDTQALLKRKEKEFEETMDQLQTDIDSLENERGELKSKLKETTKKVLLEGISRGSSLANAGTGGSPSSLNAGLGGPVSLGPSVSAPIRDSPMLLRQNQCLKMAVLSAKEECYRRQGEDLKRRLSRMKPLVVPKKLVRGIDLVAPTLSPESPACEKRDISKEETPSLDELIRKVGNLRKKIDTALISASVIDLSNKNSTTRAEGVDLMSIAGSARKDLIIKSLQEKQIKDEAEQLRLEVTRLIASRKPGGQVEADFCKFPTPQLSRALNEDLMDYKVVGRITVNGNNNEVKIRTVPVIVGPRDLRQIHQKVLS